MGGIGGGIGGFIGSEVANYFDSYQLIITCLTTGLIAYFSILIMQRIFKH